MPKTKGPKVFLILGTPAANLIQLAAEFSSVSLDISIVKPKKGERIPAVKLNLPGSTVPLTQPLATATFIATGRFCRGLDLKEECRILQWMYYARDEAHNTVGAFAVSKDAKEREAVMSMFQSLNGALRDRTFLATERLSLADCAVAVEVLPACLALGKEEDCNRERLPHLFRWINTCIHQKEFVAVFGKIDQLY